MKYKFRIAGMISEEKPMIIEIDVEPEETVADVKKKIRKELNINKTLDIQLIWPNKEKNTKNCEQEEEKN